MNLKTKAILGPAFGLLLASVPALAATHTRPIDREGEFRLRGGIFRPDGESEYWRGVERDFTGDIKDFEDPSFGLDFLLPLNDHLSLNFSGSYYQGQTTGAYRGFVDDRGDRIRHDTTLDIASATAGLVLHFTGPDAPVRPYVGIGGGAYPWRLEEEGDFIDFGPNPDEVFSARLRSSGVAFGGYGLVGLDVPISRDVSLFAEGRFTKVDDELDEDFEGFGDLDLSGREVSFGISWKL
jgi:hypothetical protein